MSRRASKTILQALLRHFGEPSYLDSIKIF